MTITGKLKLIALVVALLIAPAPTAEATGDASPTRTVVPPVAQTPDTDAPLSDSVMFSEIYKRIMTDW